MNMEELTLIPLTNEESEKFCLTELVALYKSESNGNINVGRPGLVSYFPALANMYGFDAAKDKDYYYVMNDGEMVSDKPVYKIGVDESETVRTIDILNEVECTDLLGSICRSKEIKSM